MPLICSVNEVKTFIYGSTSPSTYDSTISAIIDQIEAMLKKETGLTIVDTDYDDIDDEVVDGTGMKKIYSTYWPIQSVDKVEYRDADWSFTEYTEQAASDMEFDRYIIYTQYVVRQEGRRNLRISYTAGYKTANVPDDLKLAAIMLTAQLFNQREMVGVKTQSLLGLTMTMDEKDNKTVKRILDKYKRTHAY